MYVYYKLYQYKKNNNVRLIKKIFRVKIIIKIIYTFYFTIFYSKLIY
jgi:hypothetical protein